MKMELDFVVTEKRQRLVDKDKVRYLVQLKCKQAAIFDDCITVYASEQAWMQLFPGAELTAVIGDE